MVSKIGYVTPKQREFLEERKKTKTDLEALENIGASKVALGQWRFRNPEFKLQHERLRFGALAPKEIASTLLPEVFEILVVKLRSENELVVLKAAELLLRTAGALDPRVEPVVGARQGIAIQINTGLRPYEIGAALTQPDVRDGGVGGSEMGSRNQIIEILPVSVRDAVSAG